MWLSPLPWWWARRCGRQPKIFDIRAISGSKDALEQHEAGEGQTHAPWALPLTRLARWRCRTDPRAKSPMQAEGDITLPDIPHDARLSQNNGEMVPESNFPPPNVVSPISRAHATV
jgi:hypothetical protein